jgi:hypothetical protein
MLMHQGTKKRKTPPFQEVYNISSVDLRIDGFYHFFRLKDQ